MRLLVSKFAGRPVVVGELQTNDIRQFIADQLDALATTSNAITIASTLRAYPSRQHFLPMMANVAYREALVHRYAGLERTILLQMQG